MSGSSTTAAAAAPPAADLVPAKDKHGIGLCEWHLLQVLVDNAGLQQGRDLTAQQRQQLQNLDLGNGVTVSEGDLVEITGYIAPDRNIRASGGESGNCRITRTANNDVHLPIVAEPDDGEFDSVVVEPIPQGRPAEWTAPAFKRLQENGTMVRIRGGLFYDNHRVNDDPDHVFQSEPKRFSLSEVHPITQFLVCARDDNSCDPTVSSDWQALGQ